MANDSYQLHQRFASSMPYGTLFVNIFGTFLLGFLAGLRPSEVCILFFGTGFIGSFTTFSTFKWELIQLGKWKEWNTFVPYLFISYILGILLALLGFTAGAYLKR
ncbi:fluoride efflux transporter FluC [Brevibacillus sp. B_LB10_24]|uniref:fluoride efflux transporter FluC n=1 Tax=Brevibacillus sp. B_LB10_24 TaxID=3380645 RepID=UPI0038B74BA7